MFIIPSQTLQKKYQVYKTYPHQQSSQKQIKIAILIINIQPQYKQITSFLQPIQQHLINQHDFQLSPTVILKFKSQNQQDTYITSVSKSTYKANLIPQNVNIQSSHAHRNPNIIIYSENILVFIDQKDFKIKAINYVQDRNYQKDRIHGSSNTNINSQIVKMDKARQQIFKIVPQKQQEQQKQQQSFFSKYKWPIIIVGVLLYLSSAVDPKAGQAAGGQAAPAR